MSKLTPEGESVADEFARRYQLSKQSVIGLIEALHRGSGTMAQFRCEEFGSGQWMRGGMTMISDMFNHALKAKVNDFFSSLSNAMSREQLVAASSSSSETSGRGGNWWPSGLGSPSSSGGQNHIRYAIFPQMKRLAIEQGGHVTLYDTGEHRIGGVSQQQGRESAVQFSSQLGTFSAGSLPVVSGLGEPARNDTANPLSEAKGATDPAADAAVILRKLAALRDEGLLTEAEYAAKRKEVINRI